MTAAFEAARQPGAQDLKRLRPTDPVGGQAEHVGSIVGARESRDLRAPHHCRADALKTICRDGHTLARTTDEHACWVVSIWPNFRRQDPIAKLGSEIRVMDGVFGVGPQVDPLDIDPGNRARPEMFFQFEARVVCSDEKLHTQRLRIRVAFVPPKPKLLDMATLIERFTALCGV